MKGHQKYPSLFLSQRQIEPRCTDIKHIGDALRMLAIGGEADILDARLLITLNSRNQDQKEARQEDVKGEDIGSCQARPA